MTLDTITHNEWKELSREILLSAANLRLQILSVKSGSIFLETLTQIFYSKCPQHYTQYRALRTFVVAKWPLVVSILKSEHITNRETAITIINEYLCAIADNSEAANQSSEIDLEVLTNLTN